MCHPFLMATKKVDQNNLQAQKKCGYNPRTELGTLREKLLSQTPTPFGVVAIYLVMFHGVCLNGFFRFRTSRTPHDSKHLTRGGAEGKRTRYATV